MIIEVNDLEGIFKLGLYLFKRFANGIFHISAEAYLCRSDQFSL